ncbi:MAG: hemolysin III family protein [Erythrobacter sp.]|uniref:PAQR family membrane homeostasis protein TrhA n=1 Tax=Erythrobacter sp. TaxID=1042 RepID=UPI0032674361
MFPSKRPEERKADFVIHALSLAFILPVSGLFIYWAWERGTMPLILATIGYAIAALSSISVSFAYHLLPRHDLRSVLRRWDHAAIYGVIAGTFSPLLIMAGTQSAHAILVVIWALALFGFIFKLAASDMDPRWSVFSYLGLGALGLLAMPDFWRELPVLTTVAIGAGALFYTIGTWFYRQKERAFRYPIWHTWGTLGGLSLCASIGIALAG